MIVRILGEGQLDLPDSALDELNVLDDTLESACDSEDEDAFGPALTALLDKVRELGTPIPADQIVPSDLVLPPADASIAEVTGLLSDDGLIPG
jgi:hypothetical protein